MEKRLMDGKGMMSASMLVLGSSRNVTSGKVVVRKKVCAEE